jgi:hypothetical protein
MSEGINWKDLKQQADDATKPLPDGDYPVTVTKSELKKASTGADMVVVQLTVTGGDRAGRVLFNNFVFSPEKAFALKMWFDHLGAFGLDDNFFANGPTLEHVASALLNRSAIVTTSVREWQGRQLNECKQFKPAGGVPGLPSTMPMASAAAGSMPPVPSVSSSLPPVPAVASGTNTPPVPNF